MADAFHDSVARLVRESALAQERLRRSMADVQRLMVERERAARAELRYQAGLLRFLGVRAVRLAFDGRAEPDAWVGPLECDPAPRAGLPNGLLEAVRSGLLCSLPRGWCDRPGGLCGAAVFDPAGGTVAVTFDPSTPPGARIAGPTDVPPPEALTMPVAPEELPADLADLLAGTLGPGGLPGVLADWIDEHSADWAPLTAALRVAGPFTGPDETHHFSAPRYLLMNEDVTAFLTTARERTGQPGAPPTTVLGFARDTPGREHLWRLAVPGRPEPLRALFGGPPEWPE